MKKKLIKKILMIIAIVIATLAAAAVVVPLVITPQPLEGLSSAEKAGKPDSRFINIPFDGTDGIRIHYIDRGQSGPDGPIFILLHGSMYNLYSWDRVQDDFAARGRTIAYDQAPYGLSEKLLEGDWSGENPYTQKAAVEQLIGFLDALGLQQVYLVGSSYGGTLAVRAAAEYKERVAGLILIDPAVFVSESMPGWLVNSTQLNNVGPLFARSMGSGTSFYRNCYYDQEVFTGSRKSDSMIMTEVMNWDFALWQYLKAWSEVSFDFERSIPEISIPALIVSGAEDKVVPAKDFQKLDDLLPDSKLHIIPGTGHMPHEETPDKVLDIILPWIDSITGGRVSR